MNNNEPIRYPEAIYFNNPNAGLGEKFIGEIAISDIPRFIAWLQAEQANGAKRVKLDAMRGSPSDEYPEGKFYVKVNDYKPSGSSGFNSPPPPTDF